MSNEYKIILSLFNEMEDIKYFNKLLLNAEKRHITSIDSIEYDLCGADKIGRKISSLLGKLNVRHISRACLHDYYISLSLENEIKMYKMFDYIKKIKIAQKFKNIKHLLQKK